MFERFTERARQVVVLAQDEARSLGHDFIGGEHLLLGLLREEEGLAARVLNERGVTVDAVRARLEPGEAHGKTGQIPFTAGGKKTLELGLREALAMSHNYIGTEHLLLGLTRLDPGERAPSILASVGILPEEIRAEVMRMLSGPGRSQRSSAAPPIADPSTLAGRLEQAKLVAIERHDFEAAARLRDLQRRLEQLVREIDDAL